MLLGIRIAQPSKEITIQLTAFLIVALEPHDVSVRCIGFMETLANVNL